MALSNWDTLAIDLDGKPTNGVFTSPLGITVRIYKNWVYVNDEYAWREKGSYVKSTIMEIQEGDITYMDVRIKAIRGPQNGVYVVVWHDIYDKTKEDKDRYSTIGMIGCGVYGFAEQSEEWIGVEQSSKEFLQNWISANHPLFEEEEIPSMLEGASSRMDEKQLDEYAVSLREPSYDFPEDIAKVKLTGALRFCQGDEFFANKLGFEVPATPAGEAQGTILSGALKKEPDNESKHV